MHAAKRSIVSAIIALAFIGTYAFTHAAANEPVAAPDLEALPMVLDEWEGMPAPELPPDQAEVLAADFYLHRYYQSAVGVIEMDVAYYRQRRVGASMHSPLNCLPGTGWTIVDSRALPVDTPGGRLDVRELTVRRGESIYALAYWYQNGHRILTGEAAARFRLLGDALRGRAADVGIVRVMTPLSGEAGPERTSVAAFTASLIPELTRTWR